MSPEFAQSPATESYRPSVVERMNNAITRWFENYSPDHAAQTWNQAFTDIRDALPEGERREAFEKSRQYWELTGKTLGVGAAFADATAGLVIFGLPLLSAFYSDDRIEVGRAVAMFGAETLDAVSGYHDGELPSDDNRIRRGLNHISGELWIRSGFRMLHDRESGIPGLYEVNPAHDAFASRIGLATIAAFSGSGAGILLVTPAHRAVRISPDPDLPESC